MMQKLSLEIFDSEQESDRTWAFFFFLYCSFYVKDKSTTYATIKDVQNSRPNLMSIPAGLINSLYSQCNRKHTIHHNSDNSYYKSAQQLHSFIQQISINLKYPSLFHFFSEQCWERLAIFWINSSLSMTDRSIDAAFFILDMSFKMLSSQNMLYHMSSVMRSW